MTRAVALGENVVQVHDSGHGDPVLVVHSSGFSSRQWRKLREALEPSFRVLAVDLLGYEGSTPWPPGKQFHMEQDVAMLVALADEEPAPLHVVGHSYGGLLALKLALARPAKVRSLALYEPVAFGVLDAELGFPPLPASYDVAAPGGDAAWLRPFVDAWNGEGAWDALPDGTRRAMGNVGWKVFREVSTLLEDATGAAAYTALDLPVLLLGGETSPAPARRVLGRLAAALPRARAVTVSGAGHMGPITHAAQVNEEIARHLRSP